MKKIPTLFKRVFSPDHKTKTILPEVTPGCEAVLEGRCIPTVKWDGACCAIINGEIYKRYDAKVGKNGKQKLPPEGAIPCQPEPDPITGHWPHWVKCDPANPADKYFFDAYRNSVSGHYCLLYIEPFLSDGRLRDWTYEAVGPAWQSNPYGLTYNVLLPHGSRGFVPETISWLTTFEAIKEYLEYNNEEGLVFWLDRQPLCKIKRSDFGFPWPVKPKKTKTKKGTTMKYTYDEKGIRTDAPEWFKRLHAEWDEVRERRKRLQSFLADSEKTDKVSGAQLVLLNKQLEVMKEYSDILYVRMCLANDEFAIEKDPAPMMGSPNYEVEV